MDEVNTLPVKSVLRLNPFLPMLNTHSAELKKLFRAYVKPGRRKIRVKLGLGLVIVYRFQLTC